MTQTQARAEVRSRYLSYFGREPDASGWDNWTNDLLDLASTHGDGAALIELDRAFSESDEYKERKTTMGNPFYRYANDPQGGIYRYSDHTGFATWLDFTNAGGLDDLSNVDTLPGSPPVTHPVFSTPHNDPIPNPAPPVADTPSTGTNWLLWGGIAAVAGLALMGGGSKRGQ